MNMSGQFSCPLQSLYPVYSAKVPFIFVLSAATNFTFFGS